MLKLRSFARFFLLASSISLPFAGGVAAAQPRPVVDVINVKGLMDPALFDYVRGAIASAERRGVAMIILQIDSLGSYDDQGERLGRFIRGRKVPVVSWIAPAGARVQGGSLFVAYSSSVVAMTPGAGIGPARPFDLAKSADREDEAELARVSDRLAALAPRAGASVEGVSALLNGPALPAGKAQESGAVAMVATDVCDLLDKVGGRPVRTGGGTVVLAENRCPGGVLVEFDGMGPVRRVLHAVATPVAIYVLLILGLWAIAFEMTQPAFGIAGIAGAAFLAFAGYGLAVVPVNWLGIGLVVGGSGLQALDVIVKRVALFTGIGTALFAAGSALAWYGVSPVIDLPLWLIVLATLGGFMFFGFGMTVALRAKERVRTAQVGLVGLVGDVRTDLDPEGGVYVKGTIWRARSTDGFIQKGARVRVKGIDGLVLMVEREPDQ